MRDEGARHRQAAYPPAATRVELLIGQAIVRSTWPDRQVRFTP